MSAPHRWSKFWWQDWRNDNGLRMCSLGARGLWMEMLCIASESPRYGLVAVNMKPLSASDLSRILGVNLREVNRYIDELERNGVFSRTEVGTIYCRRMVRDHAASEGARAAGAHGGGNPQIIRGTVPKEERQRRFRRSDSPLKTRRIFEKSNGCCHWCGIPLQCEVPGPDFFHVDHVVAVRDGGGIEEDNLVAACSACNYRRARHDPGDNTPTDTNTDGGGKPNGSGTSDHKVGKLRPQLRPHTLEAEAESEAEEERSLPSPTERKIKQGDVGDTARTRAHATPLPGDWQPNAEGKQFAANLGLDLPMVAAKFANWQWKRGNTSPDWAAAWKFWCLDQVERDKRPDARPEFRNGYLGLIDRDGFEHPEAEPDDPVSSYLRLAGGRYGTA